jgi:Fic family protein
MLKPNFSISSKINNNLTQIERVRGFLEATQLKEEWLTQMQNQALILETHYSTHIEGTQLTLEQATKILTGKKVIGVRQVDKKELLNYKEAMEFVSKYLGNGELITEGLIREIHKILVKEVRGGKAEPGSYRKKQNYVINTLTGEIVYTPPPAIEVPPLMREFVEWINTSKDLSLIIVAGISQFQFVHIHPFLDGNGRTARLLSTLILYKSGYDFKRLFTISEYYDKNRPAYYKAIQSVRENNMDMTQWLEYFTEGLKSQMLKIQEEGKQVIKQDIILSKAEKLMLNERQLKAIRFIIGKESMKIQDYLKLNPEVTRRTAQRDLKDMIKKGLVKSKGATNKLVYILA